MTDAQHKKCHANKRCYKITQLITELSVPDSAIANVIIIIMR